MFNLNLHIMRMKTGSSAKEFAKFEKERQILQAETNHPSTKVKKISFAKTPSEKIELANAKRIHKAGLRKHYGENWKNFMNIPLKAMPRNFIQK